MSELEYKRILSPEEIKETKIQQLKKLLKQANKLTPLIIAEDRDERTEEELEDHNTWINKIKTEIKQLENE